MSDQAAKTRVTLNKDAAKSTSDPTSGASATASGGVPKSLPRPRTIDLACLAMIVTAVGGLINALVLRGYTSELKTYLINRNNKASKPDANFDVDKALQQIRSGALIQSVVLAVVFVLLVLALRRARSAGGSRWALLVVVFLTGLAFSIIPVSGLPVIPQTLGVIVGLTSILSLVFIFGPPQSRKYFRDCREATIPPERRGQQRPSLFGSRRGAAGGGPFSGGRGGFGAGASARAAQPSAKQAPPRAKSKVRADTDSVARGAELARARAKASKSRRTTD